MRVLVALAVAVFCLYAFFKKQRRLPTPPGPQPKFLIGNLLDFPKNHQWITFAQWSKIYDPDVIYLNLAGQNIIVLNSLAANEELLDRRSSLYSSRPHLAMICDLMGWDFAFALMKYGSTWREHRKYMIQTFSSSSVDRFKPHMMKTSHTLMRNFLSSPADFSHHITHMACEIIILITHGVQIQAENDPYVQNAERALASLNEAIVPGRFLVDAFPILKYVPEWMPFAEFKRLARKWKKYGEGMVDTPYNAVRDEILAGKGINSLVADGLRAIGDNTKSEEREYIVKSVAGTMFTAGIDTTISTILSGILALMCYPDVLKKAQAEIDSVVKPGNLPEFTDKDSLPYLSALVKELWRWSPALPLGLPHFIETEDTFKGYRIPTQSIVFSNAWAINHNEELYPDPFPFNPERFLKDGKLNTEIHDPERATFGFGRRVCAGSHFATLSIWMTMACIITLFDITKPVDENGEVIEPEIAWTSTPVSQPVPFKCKIVPRSQKAVVAIQRTEGYEYFDE